MNQTTLRLSKVSTGIALSTTLLVLFVLCAVVEVIFPGPQFTHVWISLFTASPIGSLSAWVEGIIANIVLGFIAGCTFACVYNYFVSRKA
jgi:hypothetical protein